MYLARVVGTVVSTRKEPTTEGLRFMLIRQCGPNGEPDGDTLVAADAVGAGVGEVVLYASGSSARQTTLTDGRPVDAVIMGIVDEVELGGAAKYRKSEAE
ncbi:MAG: EutN/CcmL family microcompartment protein [Myxococcales bacterium]|nr:EutN/CcmL family microcompartment protein [Myxococcales bacterium]